MSRHRVRTASAGGVYRAPSAPDDRRRNRPENVVVTSSQRNTGWISPVTNSFVQPAPFSPSLTSEAVKRPASGKKNEQEGVMKGHPAPDDFGLGVASLPFPSEAAATRSSQYAVVVMYRHGSSQRCFVVDC